jgi:hypothetical protein
MRERRKRYKNPYEAKHYRSCTFLEKREFGSTGALGPLPFNGFLAYPGEPTKAHQVSNRHGSGMNNERGPVGSTVEPVFQPIQKKKREGDSLSVCGA